MGVMTPEMVRAIGDAIVRVGLPSALVIIYLLKDWAFTGRIVANNARSIEILESIQREGVKCRHD